MSLMEGDRFVSSGKFQRMIQSSMLDAGPLAKTPGAVQPVFLVTCPTLVVYKLGDRTQQPPGGTLGSRQLQHHAHGLRTAPAL